MKKSRTKKVRGHARKETRRGCTRNAWKKVAERRIQPDALQPERSGRKLVGMCQWELALRGMIGDLGRRPSGDAGSDRLCSCVRRNRSGMRCLWSLNRYVRCDAPRHLATCRRRSLHHHREDGLRLHHEWVKQLRKMVEARRPSSLPLTSPCDADGLVDIAGD